MPTVWRKDQDRGGDVIYIKLNSFGAKSDPWGTPVPMIGSLRLARTASSAAIDCFPIPLVPLSKNETISMIKICNNAKKRVLMSLSIVPYFLNSNFIQVRISKVK